MSNDPATDSDSFHSCDDGEEFEEPPKPVVPKKKPHIEKAVVEKPESSLSSEEDNDEAASTLSVAERRRLLEEAQTIKEPEPNLSSDEADSQQSPSPTEHLPSMGLGFFSNIVNSGLDVLETLGKKTFETLTVKDENEDRRRFLLSLSDKSQNLSDILREVKAQQESEPADLSSGGGAIPTRTRHGYGSANLEKANTNFIALFERADGMVNLEGLELLSNNHKDRNFAQKVDGRFDEQMLSFSVEDVSECSTEDFVYEMKKCTLGIGLPYKAENILQADKELRQRLAAKQEHVDAGNEIVVDEMHEAAIASFAELTAHSIQALHKIAQLIVIANDLPNVELVFEFTYVLCRRLAFYSNKYADLLSLAESSKKVDDVVTNIFFECSNACHYIKKALLLLRPFFTA